MTTTTPAPSGLVRRSGRPIRVGLLGGSGPTPAELSAALASFAPSAVWDVRNGDCRPLAHAVDVALCDSVAAVAVAATRWPDAVVIVLNAAGGGGAPVVEALATGADLCVPRDSTSLIAAYLHSAARRRGLLHPAEEFS
jgi:hypothetical protein